MTQLPTPYLAQLEQDAADLAVQSRAANTIRAYKSDWAHFSAWADAQGLASMPADPRTVALYMTAHRDLLSMATLNRRLSSIAQAHRLSDLPFDTRGRVISVVMDGLRRTKVSAPRQVTALTTPLVKKAIGSEPSTLTDMRDRALILVGMAGAMRRSEIVALTIEDLTFSEEGVRVRINRSKTDQEGAGQIIAIGRTHHATCPVANLQAWLELAGITGGPVFRAIDRHGNMKASLSDQSVADIVRKRTVGLKGTFAGHSLRAGFATQAAKSGVEERKIANTTRHLNMEVLRKYIREGELFANAVTSDLGL